MERCGACAPRQMDCGLGSWYSLRNRSCDNGRVCNPTSPGSSDWEASLPLTPAGHKVLDHCRECHFWLDNRCCFRARVSRLSNEPAGGSWQTHTDSLDRKFDPHEHPVWILEHRSGPDWRDG